MTAFDRDTGICRRRPASRSGPKGPGTRLETGGLRGGLFVHPQHLAGLAIDNVDARASNALDSFQAVVFRRVCDPARHVLGCYGTAIKNGGHQLNIDATICLSIAQDQKGLRLKA
jgi:hypothetical protein